MLPCTAGCEDQSQGTVRLCHRAEAAMQTGDRKNHRTVMNPSWAGSKACHSLIGRRLSQGGRVPAGACKCISAKHSSLLLLTLRRQHTRRSVQPFLGLTSQIPRTLHLHSQRWAGQKGNTGPPTVQIQLLNISTEYYRSHTFLRSHF